MNSPYTDYSVKVHAHSRKKSIKVIDGGRIEIYTEYPAEKGLANMDIINQIASYCNVPPKQVIIIKGRTSPNKHIRVYT